MAENKIKVAFFIGSFPKVSETFIINQIADLLDRGVEVEIFSFNRSFQQKANISQRYFDYEMKKKAHYLAMPSSKILRIILALPRLIYILFNKPAILPDLFNFKKYGPNAASLKLIFWVTPFIGKKFNLVHCHFGTSANKYLIIREILNLSQPIITTFYGFDVSKIFKIKPTNYYDKLKKACSCYLVMSNNMKERVMAYGFKNEQIHVLPVSIDVSSYPYQTRFLKTDESINLISVGNFVEKKGFDDLLKALAIVKIKASKAFKCLIIGDGPLKEEIHSLADNLKLNDVVEFRGYLKLEKVIELFKKMHLFVQPSKTAKDGDME